MKLSAITELLRNGNEFTDDEAVGKTPGEGFPEARDAYKNGYNDANEDGSIDPRSGVFLGISQNCAKRDRLDIDADGVGETNLSKKPSMRSFWVAT